MISGRLFDIQRFSINDGPGIRTCIFMKGCNLHCTWCHNPESQASQPEIRYQPEKCIYCGSCISVCPSSSHRINERFVHTFQRSKCISCTQCANICNTKALDLIGREFTVEQVIAEVLKDQELYDLSGGGMTLTGGEPLVQPTFALALLQAAHVEGIHTAIETAGCVSWNTIERISKETDLFLYDLKGFNPKQHFLNTGQDNKLILTNLQRLAQEHHIIVRMPLIADLNDSTEEAKRYANFLEPLNGITQIELLPYHRFGEAKYAPLGRKVTCFNAPSAEHLQRLADIYSAIGKQVIVHTA